jgi:hypothetical protein
MAQNKITIQLERENDQGKKMRWHNGTIQMDPVTGTITLHSMVILMGKVTDIVYSVKEISAFSIVMVSDYWSLVHMYGGGLLGYLVAWIMSRWIKMPVIRLENPLGGTGKTWVQIRGVAFFQPRKATRKLANQLSSFLGENGYRGITPNLNDEEQWKFPIVPVVAGVAILIALLVLLMVCIVAAVAVTN